MTERTALSNNADKEQPPQLFKIVVFSITTAESVRLNYGVNIEQVQEIGVVEQITRVPGAPSFVRGVMNLRGKIISIIDARERLGVARSSTEPDMCANMRVIVARFGSNPVGLLVDEVDKVLEISSANVETSPDIISDNAPYINGIAKHDGKLIMLLELSAFIGGQGDPSAGRGEGRFSG
jgi:purine-binding chemotaxis protein CheW